MPDRPVRDMIHRAALVRASPDDTVRAAAKAMAEQVCGSVLILRRVARRVGADWRAGHRSIATRRV